MTIERRFACMTNMRIFPAAFVVAAFGLMPLCVRAEL